MNRANMKAFLRHHAGQLQQQLENLQSFEESPFTAACQMEISSLEDEIQEAAEWISQLMRQAGFDPVPASRKFAAPNTVEGGIVPLLAYEQLVLESRARELMWRTMANVRFECANWDTSCFDTLAERSRRRARDLEEKLILIARSRLSWLNGVS